MKKMMKKLAVVLCLVFVVSALTACGGDSKSTDSTSANGSSDSGKTDILTGSWRQESEMDGNWVFTFSDGKAKLVGETTGFTGEGTYKLDEANGKVTVMIEGWSAEKEFTYTLNGNNLKLVSTYASYDLNKQ